MPKTYKMRQYELHVWRKRALGFMWGCIAWLALCIIAALIATAAR
jgi:hypothetical protein